MTFHVITVVDLSRWNVTVNRDESFPKQTNNKSQQIEFKHASFIWIIDGVDAVAIAFQSPLAGYGNAAGINPGIFSPFIPEHV